MSCDNIKLKQCPFCGGDVEIEQTVDDRKYFGVVCRNTMNRGGTCAIQQRPSASREAAEDRWNARAPQNEWISVDNFNPKESCHAWVHAHDIVKSWVELVHIYVCPEYGNYTIECLDDEDYRPIVLAVMPISNPTSPNGKEG